MPGTSRAAPGGIEASSDGGGRLSPTDEITARWPSSSRRPATPATSEAAIRPPLRARKPRRDQSGISRPSRRTGASHVNVNIALPAAAAPGRIARVGELPPRMAAAKPSAAKAAKPAPASVGRDPASEPRPAAMSRDTSTTTISSASLSLVPNRATATSLAPGGWRSITVCPTASRSDGAPGTIPATSSAAAKATSAAATPAIA
jgi:hypothetical protein